MKLIKDPTKLKSVINPSTFTKEEVDEILSVVENKNKDLYKINLLA